MADVVRKLESMQYTGGNGQDIAAWLGGMQVISDDAGVLLFGKGEGEAEERYQITTDSWVIRDAGSGLLMTYCTPEEYAAGWLPVGAG